MSQKFKDQSILELEYRLFVAQEFFNADPVIQDELSKICGFNSRFEMMRNVEKNSDLIREEYLKRCIDLGVFKCLLSNSI